MNDNLWTRRGFLAFIGAGAAVVATAPVVDALAPLVGPARSPFWNIWISEIWAQAAADLPTAAALFSIGRPAHHNDKALGGTILRAGLSPGGVFHWLAPPGSEIGYGPGLVNQSDFGVRVSRVSFCYDGCVFQWTPGGIYSSSGSVPRPAPPTILFLDAAPS